VFVHFWISEKSGVINLNSRFNYLVHAKSTSEFRLNLYAAIAQSELRSQLTVQQSLSRNKINGLRFLAHFRSQSEFSTQLWSQQKTEPKGWMIVKKVHNTRVNHADSSTTESKGYSFDPVVLAGNRNTVNGLSIGCYILRRLKINALMSLQSQTSLKQMESLNTRPFKWQHKLQPVALY